MQKERENVSGNLANEPSSRMYLTSDCKELGIRKDYL